MSAMAKVSAAAIKPKRIVHLLVVCHGLWGQTSHVAYICRSAIHYAKGGSSARSRPRSSSLLSSNISKGNEEPPTELVVLPASLNEWTLTYDGIDICAERVCQEIDAEVEKIKEEGGEVKKFSIVGYSLGGLVARYALGLLHSRSPSFFKEVRPVNFATFASPAIGIPQYKSFWSSVFRFLGARLLSRSGAQLYENDRFLPSSLLEDGTSSESTGLKSKSVLAKLGFSREKADPLLAVMADPRYSFFQALAAFERVEIYANSVNDRTVPYPTGAIEAHDPFALARSNAKKKADRLGLDPDVELEISEGGLEIKFKPDTPIIESINTIPLSEMSETLSSSTDASIQKRTRKFRIRLPLLLRPTTYPFSRPVSLFVICFLPLTLPVSLLYLIGRFVLHGRQSRRRIRDVRKGMPGGRIGTLRRVGVRIRQAVDDVAESMAPDNPEYHDGLGSDSEDQEIPSSKSGQSGNGFLDESSAQGEEEGKPVLRHPALVGFHSSYGATETPPLTRAVSPDLSAAPTDARPYPTDPNLSDAQKLMIKNLNSIPQLRKHIVYFPLARNAHGTIVARDLSFPQHRQGTVVVDDWAKDFRL